MPAMGLAMAILGLWASGGAAHAAVQMAPDRHQAAVTVVVCPPAADPCPQALTHLDRTGAFDRNVLPLDALLELERGPWRGGVALEQSFAEALARAQSEAAAGRWALAGQSLDAAGAALAEWAGTPDNAALVQLDWLRAAHSRSLAGDGAPAPHLAQAAARAWNRPLRPPLEDPALRRLYDAELERLLAAGTGTLHLQADATGAALWVDGVPVGTRTARLALLPGVHRVAAVRPEGEQAWAAEVEVRPGEVTRARPRWSSLDDPAALRAELQGVFAVGDVRPEVADLLDAWCDRYAVRAIRLVAVEEHPGAPERVRMQDGSVREVPGLPQYGVDVRLYAPVGRSWVRLPAPAGERLVPAGGPAPHP